MKVEEKERIYNCVLVPNGYWKGFEHVAIIIEQNLLIKFKQKLNDFDSYYWIFDYNEIEINLHYHEMIGDVELFTNKDKTKNKQVLINLSNQIKNYLKCK